MTVPRLHLASASPQRRELLHALRLDFSFAGEALTERPLDGEPAGTMVLRLAEEKARAGLQKHPRCAVLGADTAVVVDGRIFGKPESRDDALHMLALLSAREHEVMTGVALACGEHSRTVLSRSRVRFRRITRTEARAYWHSGEPLDKAGGYAIQGLGGIFVEALCGSYSGVVGLPVCETAHLLGDAGIDVLAPAPGG